MRISITRIVILMTLACLGVLNYVEFFILHPLNGGLLSPDFRLFGYTFEQFTQWQTELGEEGVAAYIKWFPEGFDNYFPALVGMVIVMLLHNVLNRFPRYRVRSGLLKSLVLSIFTLPYVFFDYFENLVVLDALSGDGSVGPSTIEFASSLTVLKASFFTIAVIIIATLFWASTRVKEKSN